MNTAAPATQAIHSKHSRNDVIYETSPATVDQKPSVS